MTDDRTLERAARSWLEEGPTRAPDRPVEDALLTIETTSQERVPRLPWRFSVMPNGVRIAVAAVIGVLALAVIWRLIPNPSGIGGLTPAPSPTEEATQRPTASPFAGACLLATSEEAEQAASIIGVGALQTESGTGNETTCAYSDGGGTVLRLTWTKAGADAALAAVRATPGVEVVSGLGDEALYEPSTHTLHVRVGDAVVAIVASPAGATSAQRREAAEAIGALVAGRI